MTVTPPALSICIATRNRATLLPQLFESLLATIAAVPAHVEIIVVDNGSTDTTPAVIASWKERLPDLIALVEPQAGKCRALNRALAVTGASLVAFVDDDVQVTREWAEAVLTFFATHPHYDAAGGRVRLAPVSDPELMARVACYRSLPLYDGGDAVREGPGLAGCNMAVRRRVFDVIGGFDERLGPGASGAHEDADILMRMRAAQLRVGYMPAAIVYHAVEPARFTRVAFREFQQRMARSLYALDPQRAWRKSAGRLPGIVLSWLWWSAIGRRTRSAHSWGRFVQHAEVLRLRWRDGLRPPPPLVQWRAPARRG